MFDQLQKALNLRRQASDIINDIRKEAEAFVADNKELVEGEVVNVIDEQGNFICEGVIGACRSVALVHLRTDALSIEDEEYFNKSWNQLIYQVFAKKSDGTASLKHAIADSHWMAIQGERRGDEYYIQRKSTNLIFSD